MSCTSEKRDTLSELRYLCSQTPSNRGSDFWGSVVQLLERTQWDGVHFEYLLSHLVRQGATTEIMLLCMVKDRLWAEFWPWRRTHPMWKAAVDTLFGERISLNILPDPPSQIAFMSANIDRLLGAEDPKSRKLLARFFYESFGLSLQYNCSRLPYATIQVFYCHGGKWAAIDPPESLEGLVEPLEIHNIWDAIGVYQQATSIFVPQNTLNAGGRALWDYEKRYWK